MFKYFSITPIDIFYINRPKDYKEYDESMIRWLIEHEFVFKYIETRVDAMDLEGLCPKELVNLKNTPVINTNVLIAQIFSYINRNKKRKAKVINMIIHEIINDIQQLSQEDIMFSFLFINRKTLDSTDEERKGFLELIHADNILPYSVLNEENMEDFLYKYVAYAIYYLKGLSDDYLGAIKTLQQSSIYCEGNPLKVLLSKQYEDMPEEELIELICSTIMLM